MSVASAAFTIHNSFNYNEHQTHTYTLSTCQQEANTDACVYKQLMLVIHCYIWMYSLLSLPMRNILVVEVLISGLHIVYTHYLKGSSEVVEVPQQS